MNTPKIQYGNFIKEMCCEDCDYAGGEQYLNYRFPPMPIDYCPDCGGELKEYIGRWVFTEIPAPWYSRWLGCDTETIYHGFEKSRVVEEINNLSQAGKCDCEGCKICDSGHGYQPCHNHENSEHKHV